MLDIIIELGSRRVKPLAPCQTVFLRLFMGTVCFKVRMRFEKHQNAKRAHGLPVFVGSHELQNVLAKSTRVLQATTFSFSFNILVAPVTQAQASLVPRIKPQEGRDRCVLKYTLTNIKTQPCEAKVAPRETKSVNFP